MEENLKDETNKFVITCICCLNNNRYTRNIWIEYKWHGITEVYGSMLEKCFGIKFNLTTENVDPQICERCIKKMRHCLKFKQSILKTQKDIYQYFNEAQYHEEEIEEIGSEYLEDCIDKKHDVNTDTESEVDDDDDLGEEMIVGDDYDYNEHITNDTSIEYLEDDIFVDGEAGAAEVSKKQTNKESDPPELSIPVKPLKHYGAYKRRDYQEDQLQECMKTIKDGLMSQNQAAALFNVPRQTVQMRLKKELGNKYVEVVNRWRQNTLTSYKRKGVTLQQNEEKKKNLHLCIKKIKTGSMSVKAATDLYKVSAVTVKKALKQEYGDKYKEVLLTLRRQYYKVRRERGEVRETQFRPRNQNKPNKEILIKAIKSIKEKKMTLAGAANFFNISSKLLDRLILNEVDVENTELQDLLKPPRLSKNYSKEVLEECLENVRTGKMKQKVAAKKYNISQQTIYMKLREEFDKKSKHFEKKITVELCPLIEDVPAAEVTIEEVPLVDDTEELAEELIDRTKIIESIKLIISNTNVTAFNLKMGYYACVHCDMDTNIIDDLRIHYQTNHPNEISNYVDLFFETQPQKDVIRLDIVNLTCNICSDTVRSWNSLAQHLESHGLNLERKCWYYIIPYIIYVDFASCALCHNKFHSIMQLDQHMSKHYKNFTCYECQEGFLTEKWLIFHQHTKEIGDKECDCEMCEQLYGRIEDMSEIVEEKRSVHCHHCADGFNDYYGRYLHMLECHRHKLKEFNCDQCGKQFNWRPFYVAHLREHDEKI